MKSTLIPLVLLGAGVSGCLFFGPDQGGATGDSGAAGAGGSDTGGTTVAGNGGSGGGGGTTGSGTGGTIPGGSVVCGGVHGVQAGSPWPTLGCCPTRPYRTPLVGPTNPALAWQIDLGIDIVTVPTIAADGTLYFLTADGKLNALHPDGTPAWSFSFASSTTTSSHPAIGEDGTIYFGAEAGIYAVDPGGHEVWLFNAGGQKSPIAIGGDRTIYSYSSNGTLYAIGPDGSKRWTHSAPQWVFDSHTVFDPSVSIGHDQTIYINLWEPATEYTVPDFEAVKPDGSSLGFGPTYCGPGAEVTIGDDGTLFTRSCSALRALSPDGKASLWTVTTSGPWVDFDLGRPALDAQGNVYYHFSGTLYALNPSGTTLWAVSGGAGQVVDGSGFIYYPSSDAGGGLTVVTSDGNVFWKHDPGGKFVPTGGLAGVVLNAGVAYVVSTTMIMAFGSQ